MCWSLAYASALGGIWGLCGKEGVCNGVVKLTLEEYFAKVVRSQELEVPVESFDSVKFLPLN